MAEAAELSAQIASLDDDMKNTLLSALAENEQRVANTRANVVATNVGTQKPIVANKPIIFNRGRPVSQKPEAIEPAVAAAINPSRVANELATGTPTFNVEHEFAKVRSLTDIAAREDAAQLLFINLANEATRISGELNKQARQRAGVNDAESALNNFISVENAMKATGRLPAYANTIQVRQARETYQKTLLMANHEENDLLKNNPQLNTFKRYDALLQREFGQIDKTQQKQSAREENAPFAMTDKNLMNVSYALGLNTSDPDKIRSKAVNWIKGDKRLAAIAEADKNTLPSLLLNEDQKIRQYAFNIIKGNELANGDNNGKVPDYVNIIESLVTDRTALVRKDKKLERYQSSTEYKTITGTKSQKDAVDNFLLNDLSNQIAETAQRKFKNMNNWVFADPQIKTIIDGVKVNNKDGRVLMSDGINAVMSAEIKLADGTVMRPEEKIRRLTESLSVSMKNDKANVLLPSAEIYLGPLSAEMRTQAMRVYLKQQVRDFNITNSIGLGVMNELTDIPATVFDAGRSVAKFVKSPIKTIANKIAGVDE